MTKKTNLIDLFQRKVNITDDLEDIAFISELQRFVAQHEHILTPEKPTKDLAQIMLESAATKLEASEKTLNDWKNRKSLQNKK